MVQHVSSPGAPITALLGPTNTGKTHRCVSRMLEYDTGMIGLPLRLLAREVYDRVAREAGPDQVALLTGEEHVVPRRPRYWVCTTEAMPSNVDVDFLAVDEIQLTAHPTRGHVFTDRLLRARGRFETWFLGAGTMRQTLEQLVPTARFQAAARLSKLSFTGAVSLGQIPERSAVVAFSVQQVYELAERLRVRKGGVAVVLGALSPKTRNAQVSMYEAGEVDHLVATDAIGMGLNMSIAHVALATLHKFDGRALRALVPAELAQIVGRAGRSLHDGTFGTVEPSWLDPGVAQTIEQHAFPQVRQVFWRNHDLDYTSLAGLFASLSAPPNHPCLRLMGNAPDTTALSLIAELDRAKPLLQGPDNVKLLWEVCQIPDYRQLLPDLHAELLFTIFERLVRTGQQLDDEWMASRLSSLSQTLGDIDTLTSRIAFVRTWTYLSQRREWVRNAAHWQDQTRLLEDQLSDALHERLIARFVSRRRNAKTTLGSWRRTEKDGASRGSFVQATSTGDDVDPSHPFAALVRFKTQHRSSALPPDPIQTGVLMVHDDGSLRLGALDIGRMEAGPRVTTPSVFISYNSSGNERSALRERALRATRNYVDDLLVPLEVEADASSAVRGIYYQLRSGLGTVLSHGIGELKDSLTAAERTTLQRRGIVLGKLTVFSKRMLKTSVLRRRWLLACTFLGNRGLPLLMELGRVSVEAPPRANDPAALLLGYFPTRLRWVRCDVAERVLEVLAQCGKPQPSELAGLLGCRKNIATRVSAELRELGGVGPVGAALAQRVNAATVQNRPDSDVSVMRAK